MPIRYRFFLSGLILLLFSFSVYAQSTARLTGRVLDAQTQAPLPGANVTLAGTTYGAAAGADGRFEITGLPTGTATVEASMLGFETGRRDTIRLDAGATVELTFELSESAVSLREVVITPGRFAIMQQQPTAPQTLSQEDIRTVPQLGEDVYRAVTRLPGLSGGDFSSRFTVRGGEHDEVLVMLDGLELYDPFHLKDIDGGAVSVIDVEAIGGIDMMTGAFPAEYGDRLSGVFNIASARARPGGGRTSVGLSFMNLRVMTEGTFDDGKGEWLVLGRRGYLDLVLGLTGNDGELSPTYYDGLAKLKYRLHPNHSLSIQALVSDDKMDFNTEDDPNDVAETGYGNGYLWANWNAILSTRLLAQTVVSTGRITTRRDGRDVSLRDGFLFYEVHDDRTFNFGGLRQDWSFDLSSRALLKWGFELKQLAATYDYNNVDRINTTLDGDRLILDFDSTQAQLDPSGTSFGAYVSQRVRLARPLTAELGLRYDHTSWTDDDTFGPRVNLAYAPGRRTTIRAGWGLFHQTQGIHELYVPDGDNRFYPAEQSEHRLIGLEHSPREGLTIRLDAYQKKLSDVRPYYLNLDGDVEVFPEVVFDRVRLEPERGEARGLEFFVKKEDGGKFNWWASYGLAVAEDRVNGVDIPKSFDQRHTIYVDASYRPSRKWGINAAWQYHTGWPYTVLNYERIDNPDGSFGFRSFFGPVNGEQLPAYHRLDVRVNRTFELSRSRLAVFLEVRNLYNRKNARTYYYDLSVFNNQGDYRVERYQDDWLPILPSFGIRWDFLH